MRISVETIGRKFKTRQTPRGQRQASLLASTAAKNHSWPAPAQMRLPCRANGSDALVCGSGSRLGVGLGLGLVFHVFLACFLCCLDAFDLFVCLFDCLFVCFCFVLCFSCFLVCCLLLLCVFLFAYLFT